MSYMAIPTNIFRGYDIRGLTGSELTPELLNTLGKAYATFLYRRQIRECVVGMDIRETSPAYKEAFIKGLTTQGIDVIDFGLTLTQIMYFAQYHYLSKGGAMITASHNPREFNGLKLAVGFSDTLVGSEIQEIRQIAESGQFAGWGKEGTVTIDDVFPSYKADLFKRIPLHDSGLTVVVDSSCATTGKFLPEILREAGCTVIEQNTNLDPTFPLGTPDPTEESVLKRLSDRVLAEGADLGVTYDSDGDRLGVVDSTGRLLWNDILVALFSKDILHFLPGSPIVFNALCSKTVIDTIHAAGGVPTMWLTGHSFIKAKVRETRAPFGGELSGHFFFMDNFFGHDDGAFATLRLLQFLKREGKKLSQVVDELPAYIGSPEIKLGLGDQIKFDFIKNHFAKDLTELVPNATYTDIDGFRADSETGMAIIRASQNGPYVTIKFEGKTQEEYDRLKVSLRDILKKYPEVDWTSGVNTHAFE